MRPDLRFDFIADMQKHQLVVRREFAAGRQLVWDCHTRQEYLDQWFAPRPLRTTTKHMDFREGGHWHYGMVMPDGQTFWSRQDYLTIRPIDGYAALDGFSNEAGEVNADLPRSRWDVTFAEGAPGRTLVSTVVQYQSADDLQKVIDMGMKDGLTSTLERLDELLETLAQPATPA